MLTGAIPAALATAGLAYIAFCLMPPYAGVVLCVAIAATGLRAILAATPGNSETLIAYAGGGIALAAAIAALVQALRAWRQWRGRPESRRLHVALIVITPILILAWGAIVSALLLLTRG